MKDKLECPYCFNASSVSIYVTYVTSYMCSNHVDKYYVMCDECELRGPTKYSEFDAIEAFKELINKRFIKPEDV